MMYYLISLLKKGWEVGTKLLILGLFLGGMLTIGIVTKLMASSLKEASSIKPQQDVVKVGMFIFIFWVIFCGLFTFGFLAT